MGKHDELIAEREAQAEKYRDRVRGIMEKMCQFENLSDGIQTEDTIDDLRFAEEQLALAEQQIANLRKEND